MPQLIVANAAQLRLIWSVGGSLTALNVMGVVNAGGVTITQALVNSIGTAIKAGVTSSGLGVLLHTSFALASVGLRDIRTANTAEFIDTAGATAGAGTGGLLPPQTALVVTLRTAQAGRSFRGRVYLCGFDETCNSTGGLAVTASACTNFVAAVGSALTAQGMTLGVLSRPRAAPLTPSAGFVTPVTAIVLRDSVWDTQRRRAIPGI